jgi:hypothetical protein
MAGGGSTVRGVSEDDDCVAPFVCAEYRGQKGTFAVMADGKVRFIPATIDPKIFRALCTIAGDEPITNLEGVAPEVPNEDPTEQETEPVVPAAGPETPVAGGKFPAGWKEHVSKEGRFAVAFPPGTPRQTTENVEVPGVGDITVQVVGVEREGGKGMCAVSYRDYPPAILNKGPDAVLEGAKTRMVALYRNAKVSGESKISLDGNPGREVTVTVPGEFDLRARYFLVKNRLYQVIAGGKTVDAKDQKAFFDSFRLTK